MALTHIPWIHRDLAQSHIYFLPSWVWVCVCVCVWMKVRKMCRRLPSLLSCNAGRKRASLTYFTGGFLQNKYDLRVGTIWPLWRYRDTSSAADRSSEITSWRIHPTAHPTLLLHPMTHQPLDSSFTLVLNISLNQLLNWLKDFKYNKSTVSLSLSLSFQILHNWHAVHVWQTNWYFGPNNTWNPCAGKVFTISGDFS